ncbi:MAG: peptide methionine sulfoxide reductase [Sulfurovum sp.]|nr:MAG: peptide methionine sulfoxide reductase [Sulfurovum sp.]
MIVGKIGFGGGCHWCTEAVFQSLRGVKKVEQGWISSTLPKGTAFSEAVIVYFDASQISLDSLTGVHLYTHNATSSHTLRDKYRSAVYTFSKEQQKEVQTILEKKQKIFTKPLITKAYPFGHFKLNVEQYLNYYKNNPDKPFCQIRIEPKLKILLKHFKELM